MDTHRSEVEQESRAHAFPDGLAAARAALVAAGRMPSWCWLIADALTRFAIRAGLVEP